MQFHHIQPQHSGGPDETWNSIRLSISDHAKAHLLLFECYGNYYDQCAYALLLNQQTEAYEELRKEIQANMKRNKKGFYDSKLQSELGSRKKNRKPKARNELVIQALVKGFYLQNNSTNDIFIIKPNECESLSQVMDKWMKHPSMVQDIEKWQKQKTKYHKYTGLIKMLTGFIDPVTNKRIYSISNWRVGGLFLDYKPEISLD